MDTAMDLSLRSRESSQSSSLVLPPPFLANSVIRPTPRPPWSILWYQNLLPAFQAQQQQQQLFSEQQQRFQVNASPPPSSLQQGLRSNLHVVTSIKDQESLSQSNFRNEATTSASTSSCSRNLPKASRSRCGSSPLPQQPSSSSKAYNNNNNVPVIDIACCDGPVHFERVSNPNFAVTVEHHVDVGPSPLRTQKSNNLQQKQPHEDGSQELLQVDSPPPPDLTSATSNTKTYLCIYCNQSFKSLFCYQKHKKRHLNPVSVDITGVPASSARMPSSSGRASDAKRSYSYNNKTRDLNVQFFPCKKCGSKFPSYYFVHKHKKVCH